VAPQLRGASAHHNRAATAQRTRSRAQATEIGFAPAADAADASLAAEHLGALADMVPDSGTARRPLTFVFVASECAPFSKTGGLADVVGSLPPALAARGHRCVVVTPGYDDYGSPTGVVVDCHGETVGLSHKRWRGVDYCFVDHPSFRRPGGLYGDADGVYGDNQWRFKTLCLAACEAPLCLPLPPAGAPDGSPAGHGIGGEPGEPGANAPAGDDVVFVANDWHAGLVPVYLGAHYRRHGVYRDARTVLALHNLRHQGVYSPFTFEDLGLPEEWRGAVEWQYPMHQRQGSFAEGGRAVNTLKGAICCSDRLVTVSPTYAQEIATPWGGWGMEGLLEGRRYVLNGILNGVDLDEWGPGGDDHLVRRYSADTWREGKAVNKAALRRELGLPDVDRAMFTFVGRLDDQKGSDLVLAAVPWLVEQGCTVVMLGSGDKGQEAHMRWLEEQHPEHFRGYVGFNVGLSHRITASGDVFLMPSRFEPCGLNQMYCQRYGQVPIVAATGGLRDSVDDYRGDRREWIGREAEPGVMDRWGTGFQVEGINVNTLKEACWRALQVMRHDPDAWAGLVERGMRKEFGWGFSAQQWEQVAYWAKTDSPTCG